MEKVGMQVLESRGSNRRSRVGRILPILPLSKLVGWLVGLLVSFTDSLDNQNSLKSAVIFFFHVNDIRENLQGP